MPGLGGLIGLTLPVDRADRFASLIIMNTAFATGELSLGEGFEAWKAFNRLHPDLDVAQLFKRGTPILTDADAAAYGAPFPDIRYKAGVRRFPEPVPVNLDAPGAAISRRARDWFRDEWAGESFMAVGAADPVITPAAMARLRSQIRKCREPMMIEEVGHFVQEWGEAVAKAAVHAFAAY